MSTDAIGNSENDEWADLAAWWDQAVRMGTEGAGLADTIREDWEDLSQTKKPWTTDTVMNEVVNSWEHWTPFVGETIQHSIELGSWWLRNFWPTAGSEMAAWAGPTNDADGDDATPATELTQISQDAVARMLDGSYEAADAVEDWAVSFGVMAKEAWRQAAKTKHSGSPPGKSPPEERGG